MSTITAKMIVNKHEVNAFGGIVTLNADYQDGKNKEWAEATPSATFALTVKKNILEFFPIGQSFDVTFKSAEVAE